MKRIFIISGFALMVSFVIGGLSEITYAAEEYKLIEQVPFIPQDASFPEYLEGIYKFAIGTVGIAALLMLVVGGFWYMTSAGNQAQATNAKRIIWDALLGLIVVFFAWLLLYTINPDLLRFDPETPQLSGSPGGGVSHIYRDDEIIYDLNDRTVMDCSGRSTDPYGECTGPNDISDEKLEEICSNTHWGNACDEFCKDNALSPMCRPQLPGSNCRNCILADKYEFAQKTPPNGCAGSGPTCRINPQIGDKLQSIYDDGVENFTVSELDPPTRTHKNSCHSNGTCVDVSMKDYGYKNSDIKSFYDAAKSEGLYPIYEVSSDARRKELIAAGIPENHIKNYAGHINGQHFSVYQNKPSNY